MYTIRYNNITGMISNMSKHGAPPEKDGWTVWQIPEDWDIIFDEMSNGKRERGSVIVDVNSKEPKLMLLNKTIKKQTEEYNVEIPRKKNKSQLMIRIISEDNLPYIEITNNSDKNNVFYVYLTKKNNINYLYQQFCCDEKHKKFVLLDIDPDLLYSGNFSLYYKKIFDSEAYDIL